VWLVCIHPLIQQIHTKFLLCMGHCAWHKGSRDWMEQEWERKATETSSSLYLFHWALRLILGVSSFNHTYFLDKKKKQMVWPKMVSEGFFFIISLIFLDYNYIISFLPFFSSKPSHRLLSLFQTYGLGFFLLIVDNIFFIYMYKTIFINC